MKKLFLLLAACGIVGVSYANEPAKTVNVYNYTNCFCILAADGQSVTCNNEGTPENVYEYYPVSDSQPDTSKQPVTISPVVSRSAGAELFTAVPMYENAFNEYYYWISSFNSLKKGDSGISPSSDNPVHPGDSLVVVQFHSDNIPSLKIGVLPQKSFNVKTCKYIPDLGAQKVIR